MLVLYVPYSGFAPGPKLDPVRDVRNAKLVQALEVGIGESPSPASTNPERPSKQSEARTFELQLQYLGEAKDRDCELRAR